MRSNERADFQASQFEVPGWQRCITYLGIHSIYCHFIAMVPESCGPLTNSNCLVFQEKLSSIFGTVPEYDPSITLDKDILPLQSQKYRIYGPASPVYGIFIAEKSDGCISLEFHHCVIHSLYNLQGAWINSCPLIAFRSCSFYWSHCAHSLQYSSHCRQALGKRSNILTVSMSRAPPFFKISKPYFLLWLTGYLLFSN